MPEFDVFDVVIPARNASMTISSVVRQFAYHPAIGNIIVVNNPPDEDTSLALREFDTNVTEIPVDAAGKGQAVMFGLEAVATPHVIFCDADLIGFTEDHVSQMIMYHTIGERCMTIGLPEIPANYPNVKRSLRAWPWISGERVVPRNLVKPLILHGYLMETQINFAAYYAKLPVHFEWLDGCFSPYNLTEERTKRMEEDYKWGRDHGILA
jgi:glycosyltransferase involved in cell wall biosynthesis